MNAYDQTEIRAVSLHLIQGTGETILRRRLDRALPPRSYDPDYREIGPTAPSGPSGYLDLSIPAKLFWQPGARFLATIFGGEVACEVVAKIPWGSDVRVTDEFQVRGEWYRLAAPPREPPLRGYLALALARKAAQ